MSSIDIVNPYNLKPLGSLKFNTEEEIEAVFARAYHTHKTSTLPKDQRIAILQALIKEIEANKEQFIRDAASEGGKPYIDSVIEINRGISGVQNAIEEIGQLKGREIPMGLNAGSKNRMAFTPKRTHRGGLGHQCLQPSL